MCFRERPLSFGPSPIGKYTLVARKYESRSKSLSARLTISSAAPRMYTLAVSKKLMPISYALFMQAVACSSATLPPYVNQLPREISLTLTPLPPSLLYSTRTSNV